MIVMVTDPISNIMVTNPKDRPFIIQGEGRNSTKIYFESQANKERYLKQYTYSTLKTDRIQEN